MPLSTKITAKVDATQTNTADLATPTARHILEYSRTWASGTGASQADKIWSDTRTLAATSENLDLAGVLSDLLGGTVTFAKVKMILITNDTTTAGRDLIVGNASSNGWYGFVGAATHTVIVPAGGAFLWADPNGKTVTAGTGDLLKIDAGSNSVTYSIVIVGSSA